MGRHGGGSRSGGSSSRSSSSSGGRGGGSSVRTSTTTPFRGCYNRSYYDRNGTYHTFYTSDKNFGTKNGKVGVIIFLIIHMIIMMGAFSFVMFSFGSPIDGNKDRIYVEDTIDLLSSKEEKQVLELFEDVYDQCGMPVALYVDDFSWKEHYHSIEIFSEELYYKEGRDEKSMIIVFTTETSYDGYFDWEYDIYCGDDTIKCLSNAEFDMLLEDFHKGLAREDLIDALEYGFEDVLPKMGRTEIHPMGILIELGFIAFYSMFFIAVSKSSKEEKDAFCYFKEHPEKLEMKPMEIYSVCPFCGAQNTDGLEICPYCGSLLKLKDGNTTYVRPE